MLCPSLALQGTWKAVSKLREINEQSARCTVEGGWHPLFKACGIQLLARLLCRVTPHFLAKVSVLQPSPAARSSFCLPPPQH